MHLILCVMVAQYTLYKHDKPAQCTPYQHHFLHSNLMFELRVFATLHYIGNILFLVPVCNKKMDFFPERLSVGLGWKGGGTDNATVKTGLGAA